MQVKSWRSGSLTRVRDAHTFTYFCSLGGVIAALFRQEVQGVENVDMEALWREHCGLCRYLVQRNRWITQADPSVSTEDLTQTAFFGLVKAAETWDRTKGKSFSSWAAWAIVREYRRLIGWFSGETPPAHVCAQSLDIPAYDEDDGGETKLDLLEDGALPDASEAVEAKEIAQAIDEALERLKVPGAQEVLRLKYCEQRTQAQIAAQTGLTCPEVKSIVDRSLRALLRDWRLKRAVSLWDELPSYSTGVQTFKASGSQTERAALWLIDRGA